MTTDFGTVLIVDVREPDMPRSGLPATGIPEVRHG